MCLCSSFVAASSRHQPKPALAATTEHSYDEAVKRAMRNRVSAPMALLEHISPKSDRTSEVLIYSSTKNPGVQELASPA